MASGKDRIPKRKATSFINSSDDSDYIKDYIDSHASSSGDSRSDLEYQALANIRSIAEHTQYYNDNEVRNRIQSASDKQLSVLARISGSDYFNLSSRAGFMMARGNDSAAWLLYH